MSSTQLERSTLIQAELKAVSQVENHHTLEDTPSEIVTAILDGTKELDVFPEFKCCDCAWYRRGYSSERGETCRKPESEHWLLGLPAITGCEIRRQIFESKEGAIERAEAAKSFYREYSQMDVVVSEENKFVYLRSSPNSEPQVEETTQTQTQTQGQ